MSGSVAAITRGWVGCPLWRQPTEFSGVGVFNAFFWLQNYTKFHGGGLSGQGHPVVTVHFPVSRINPKWVVERLGKLENSAMFDCQLPGFLLFGLSKWWVLMGYPPRMTTITSIFSWLDLDGLHITTFLGEDSISGQITRKGTINRIFIIIHQPWMTTNHREPPIPSSNQPWLTGKSPNWMELLVGNHLSEGIL